MNYHIITRYGKTKRKLKNSCQNAGNRDSELHESKIFPGEHAPGPPRSFEVLPLKLSKIFYPKIATSLIARIVENNEDRNIIG